MASHDTTTANYMESSSEKERLEDVDLDTPEVDKSGKVAETMRSKIPSPLTLYSHFQLFNSQASVRLMHKLKTSQRSSKSQVLECV
jgi:hypothetical protein